MDKTITVNVAFNISNPLHDEIVNTSLEIKNKYGSDWFVDEERYHLHFPVYLFAAPAKNEPIIIKEANVYLHQTKKVEVISSGLFYNQNGLIMIGFSLNEKIYQMHVQAVKIFNPLREGILRDKDRNSLLTGNLSAEKQNNTKTYGSQHVFENYQPHITIARLPDLKLCQELISGLDAKFKDKITTLERLQIHKAISEVGNEDKTVLIFDKELN